MGDDARRRGRGGSFRPVAEEEGQSTLEYLLVFLGVVAIVVALYALVEVGAKGTLSDLATRSASHSIGAGDGIGGIYDIYMY